MNLIGKILVGVIFVMSIVFMTLGVVLYSTQSDWRNRARQFEEEKNKVSTQNTKLQTEITNLQDEKKRLEDELQDDNVKLVAKNNELKEDNDRLIAQEVELRQELNNMTILLTSTQKNMADLRDEVLDNRNKIEVAQTALHEQFVDLAEASDTARQLALELATLKQTADGLKKQLADAVYLLTQLGYGDLAPAMYDKHLLDVPPRVDGTITDIRPDGYLVINIGRDDGLLKGHKLHAYRDNNGAQSYLGRIEIIDVKPGQSVGKIMPEYRTGTILRNDNVTAYLSQVTASL